MLMPECSGTKHPDPKQADAANEILSMQAPAAADRLLSQDKGKENRIFCLPAPASAHGSSLKTQGAGTPGVPAPPSFRQRTIYL